MTDFVLEFEKFGIAQAVSKRMLENMPGADIYTNILRAFDSDHLVLEIQAKIAGSPLCDVKEEWPVDWVQAFKERWFPQWLRKWFPVKYKTIHIRASELATKLCLPKDYGPIPFMNISKGTYTETYDKDYE